jgi:hypothetical protein
VVATEQLKSKALVQLRVKAEPWRSDSRSITSGGRANQATILRTISSPCVRPVTERFTRDEAWAPAEANPVPDETPRTSRSSPWSALGRRDGHYWQATATSIQFRCIFRRMSAADNRATASKIESRTGRVADPFHCWLMMLTPSLPSGDEVQLPEAGAIVSCKLIGREEVTSPAGPRLSCVILRRRCGNWHGWVFV